MIRYFSVRDHYHFLSCFKYNCLIYVVFILCWSWSAMNACIRRLETRKQVQRKDAQLAKRSTNLFICMHMHVAYISFCLDGRLRRRTAPNVRRPNRHTYVTCPAGHALQSNTYVLQCWNRVNYNTSSQLDTPTIRGSFA